MLRIILEIIWFKFIGAIVMQIATLLINWTFFTFIVTFGYGKFNSNLSFFHLKKRVYRFSILRNS